MTSLEADNIPLCEACGFRILPACPRGQLRYCANAEREMDDQRQRTDDEWERIAARYLPPSGGDE